MENYISQIKTPDGSMYNINANTIDGHSYSEIIESLEEINWEDLKDKRDNGELIPGKKYRIIDYTTTTSDPETMSAGHQFDVIVVADGVDVLNENATACVHEEDEYFSNSRVNSWILKYSLDNDNKRFAWADVENGKGVIYYMKDEWNNECPYDFKNIMFKRYHASGEFFNYYFSNCDWEVSPYIGFADMDFKNMCIDDEDDYAFRYTFTRFSSSSGEYEDSSVGVGESNLDSDAWDYNFSSVAYGNVIKDCEVITQIDEDVYNCLCLNNIVFCDSGLEAVEFGGTAIYGNSFCVNCMNMTLGGKNYNNSFGVNCKNIISGNIFYNNTFGSLFSVNTFGDSCHHNTFGNECGNNTFGNYCSSNTFGDGCSSNTFGGLFSVNTFGNECDNNTFGTDCCGNTFENGCSNNTFVYECYNNTFGNYCSSNTFGNECGNNTFGNYCSSNTFGDMCNNNTFVYECYDNIFGDKCDNNTFGRGCMSNTFGNDCHDNIFGDKCDNNTFGDMCNSNTFGNGCCGNTFENECDGNTFGNYCSSNTFGNNCYYNAFENGCDNNSFGDNCESNTFFEFVQYLNATFDYIRYLMVESGNRYLTLTSDGSGSENNYLQNIQICLGTAYGDLESSRVTINMPNRNLNYKTMIGRSSNGTISMYNPFDVLLVSNE